jgi:membrane associated rhomboid family serine protease
MNITGLWIIGHTIEKNHGSFVAALLFIIPGVGGNLLSGLFLPQAISVGASGGKQYHYYHY